MRDLRGGLGMLFVGLALPAAAAAQAADPSRPSEEEMFGGAPASVAPAPASVAPAPASVAPAPASAPADRPTEDEMFGGAPASAPEIVPAPPPAPAPAPAPEPSPPPPAPAPLSAAPSPDDDTLSGRALMREDIREEVAKEKLEIGGNLLLRLQSTFLDDTTFSNLDEQALSSPNLLDVYLDARPSDRVRAFVEARFSYDPTLENGRATLPGTCVPSNAPLAAWTVGRTVGARTEDAGNSAGDTLQGTTPPPPRSPAEQAAIDACEGLRDAVARSLAPDPFEANLNQLWLKFDLNHSVYVTLGKQRVKWGAAHLWNPTDFLNTQLRDPFSQIDLRPGITLVKVQVPWESQTANLYLVGTLDEATRLGDVGGAIRADLGFSLGEDVPGEVSLTAAVKQRAPLRLGGDLSFGLWQLDLYGEAAVSHGHYAELPGEDARDADWIPHAVGGLSWQVDYGDQDSLTWGLEYSYNDAGVGERDDYVPALLAGRSSLALTRHAAGGYVMALAPGSLNNSALFLTGLMSLDDRSGTAFFQWSETVLTWLSVQPQVGVFLGDRGDLMRMNVGAFDPFAPTTAYIAAVAGVWLQMKL